MWPPLTPDLGSLSPLAARYAEMLRRLWPDGFSLAEGELWPASPNDIPELEWQSRWFSGQFGRLFHGVDGQSIRIVQFGHWNHGPGPDFRDCAVEIDGTLHRGSIELDPTERDWEHHGHWDNPSYNDVILHVFLASGRERFFTRTSENHQITQVLLTAQNWLVETPPRPPAAHLGRCHASLAHWPAERLEALFTSAARFRLEKKALRWRRLAELHGRSEALYQGLAECLGYSKNKLPMLVLAQQFPVAWLQRHQEQREAALFGAAGFLDGVKFDSADTTTKSYLRTQWESWWKYRSTWREKPHPHPLPWAPGSRPSNHPQRRVAALAALATEWKQILPLLDAASFSQKPFLDALAGLKHSYWSYHFTLTSDPTTKPLALIGNTRRADMLGNVVYPLLVTEEEKHWKTYLRLRALLENDKTRLATLRILGETPRAADFTKLYYQQQALLQIFEDFCLRDASDCIACPFPEQMEQF